MEAELEQVPRPPHGVPKGKGDEYKEELKYQNGDVEDLQQISVDPNDDGTVDTPINREPSMKDLVANFITDVDNYDRNHGMIQHRLASDHRIAVDGLVAKGSTITLTHLMNDFHQYTVTCALQCAGNRRHSMRTRIKEVQGVDWFDAAIMNVQWEGPKLRDVLLSIGLRDDLNHNNDLSKYHVQFASYGGKTQEDSWYGGSVPLSRVMDANMDVILALKMNGRPLSARHGFPVRSIVPGVLGARSVKWLDRITISDQESPCFYQRHDYKVLPPDAVDSQSAEQYWRCVEARGYAVPHGTNGPIVRVQVSGDEGETWVDATLDNGGELASKWTWVLWSANVKMERGKGKKIYAKATDKGGNTQTMEKSTWNLRGVAYNGYEAVYNLTVR